MGWKKLSKTELARLAVLLVYLPFSLYFDWQHFSFSERSSYLLYTICKLVQLFLLYLFLGQVLTALRKKRIEGKFRLALLIFAVLIVGLLLLWPGNWVEVDEYKIYQYALLLKVHPTRGLLIAVLYIVGLMFFFHPVMIVGLQLVLGAWIYADLIQQCSAVTGKKARSILVVLFSPAALYYLYQPMRTFLFGILLVMFLQRYLMLWNRQGDDNFQRDILRLSLLVAGIICIRTEIKFLLIFYPVMLAALFVRKKLACIRQVVTAVLVMGLALVGYTVCERSCAGGDSPVALNYVMPIYTILQDPKFDREAHREELESIDRVYAIDEIMSQTNFVFWAFWIPILITVELFLVALWEKRLDFVLVLSVLLIELAGVVLTAPVKYAMYYFANYLGGWYFLYLYCALARTNQVVCAGNRQRD